MHYDADYALAVQLQEQYNKNSQSNNNGCETPVKLKRNIEKLSSPSLELHDPNPSVHALFMQFNRQFFWNRLSTVVVRWSKRMYSCAGICRYEGRAGFCEIGLSEPLLKLRPRKDMIETLLHEMIHAYLFLTKRNRDRDGHGPDFHEHMFRINHAADLNISVYHTFTEEVRFYQTHWWRCSGHCQKLKPFFGLIRRSSNRAPGPSDYWWSKHELSCGGKFIKIKEPEKNIKNPVTTVKPPLKIGTKDIRRYFNIPEKSSDRPSASQERDMKSNISFTTPNGSMKYNTSRNDDKNSTRISRTIDQQNNSNTEWSNTDNRKLIKGHPVNEKKISNVQDAVRNHWASKYVDDKKRAPDEDIGQRKACKIFKSDNLSKSEASGNRRIETAPSKISMPINKFNDCKQILYDVYGEDVITDSVLSKLCETDEQTIDRQNDLSLSSCPICDVSVLKKSINSHLDQCLLTKEFTDNDFQNEPSCSKIDLTIDKKYTTLPASSESVIDLTDARDAGSGERLHNCPVCNKLINVNSTEDHLEECLSEVFQNKNNDMQSTSDGNGLSDDDFDEVATIGTKVPCPCCYMLFEESEMNVHLDGCLI